MKTTRYVLPLLLVALAGCSNNEIQDTLGLSRKAPDEFVVYSRPPLSVPPEFELKPPRPGEENPNIVSTEAQARELLLGTKAQPASLDEASRGVDSSVDTAVTPVLTTDAPTGADSSFLSKLGADKADPDIREQLTADQKVESTKKKKTQSLYESIVGDEKAEPVVDAKAEAERIRTNRDEGKPITDGATPDAKEKDESVIDKIF